MGVYIFKSIHYNAIKIGYTKHDNPWKRVMSKGFYSCICPSQIKDKVGIFDLELISWFPKKTLRDEKEIHRLLISYRICGEWFRVDSFELINTFISDINEAKNITNLNNNFVYTTMNSNIPTYPSNIGKPWGDAEIVQLLKEIQKKMPIDEIAVIHKRTYGGIRSRLRELAADYYFNDERPISQIMKFTSLSEEEILDAINRRKSRLELLKQKQNEKTNDDICFSSNKLPPDDTNKEILSTLKDIKSILLEMNFKLSQSRIMV